MADGATVGKGYIQIIPSAKGISGKIKSALGNEPNEAGTSAGQTLGSSLGSALKKAIAAAGIGVAIKSSLDAGGAIQQSFGGLDTLYGSASTAAKEYAQQAYQAGISANNYAEQAVSFGAALKSAFGGDVTKAAEAANQAIMDMADNSAKMGTDISSVSDAYAGFSKQNYTMLDNLKLGYGGTKTEMERLLADAEKLTGVHYDIDNLGDVYSAIHAIQEDLGITGVASKEASTTFTGSFDAMKAAAENLMASLSTSEMDVTPQMNALVETASTFFFGNLVPMLASIAASLPEAIGTAITTAVPIIQEQAGTLLTTLSEGISSGGGLSAILEAGTNTVNNFITGILNNLPSLLQQGGQFVVYVANGILQNLPQLITSAGSVITTFAGGILSNLPTILQNGYQMLTQLAQGIINNLPAIVSAVAQVIAKFVATVTSNLPQILSTGISIVGKVAAGIINGVTQIPSAVSHVISSIRSAFSGIDWSSIGSNIISGIVSGISSAASSLFSSLKNLASSALSSAKSALGINSPSKKFRDIIGRGTMEGWALGITSNKNLVLDAIGDAATDSYGLDLQSFSVKSRAQAQQSNGKVVELLEVIAEKDFTLYAGRRELTNWMKEEGVKFA